MSEKPQKSFLARPVLMPDDQRAREVFAKNGVDMAGVGEMLGKTRHHNILIERQECRVANIIKQEMLSVGGDAAVARGVINCSIAHSDILLMGTTKQLHRFCKKISSQPFGLAKLACEIEAMLDAAQLPHFTWLTARREIALGARTLVMGILNVTPDSFSDGGAFVTPEAALAAAAQMEQEGADIIDIGGESSRPGALPIDIEEEWRRVAPVIQTLSQRLEIPLSIDTTKTEIARRAIAAGVEIINDISALRFDGGMADIAATSRAGLVLMHILGEPRTMQQGAIHYNDVIGDIASFLRKRVDLALAAGVEMPRIVLDPGIGFGKRCEDNVAIIARLQELSVLGFPLLVGASRKAFIGTLTGEEVAGRRVIGSVAAHCVAALHGAQIVRAHDVAATRKALAVIDAIKTGANTMAAPMI